MEEWKQIEIDGIKVNVKVVEKPKVPDKINEDIACNIISSKPGLIVSIDTYQGTPKVKPGDVVLVPPLTFIAAVYLLFYIFVL